MTLRTRSVLALGALLLASSATAPHDTWLLAVATDDAGRRMQLSIRTGMDFPESTTAVATSRFTARHLGPDGDAQDVHGWTADDSTGHTLADLGALQPGLHMAVVDIAPRQIELDAQSFNQYLLGDGMPAALEGRIARDELDRDAVERYRKCAKVIFAIGDRTDGPYDRALGSDIEIVPLENPLDVQPRDTLPVRVLWRGEPLAAAHVCWDRPGNGHAFTGTAVTDAAGEALVPIVGPGWMTIRLTHMTRPRTDAFEWESFWASLTFHVGS